MARVRQYSDCARIADGREYIDDRRWLWMIRLLVGLGQLDGTRPRSALSADTRDWQAPCLRRS